MFRGGQLFVGTSARRHVGTSARRHVGTSDESAPVLYATYELTPAPVAEEMWLYRHVTTFTG
jgi:hypothetical protein